MKSKDVNSVALSEGGSTLSVKVRNLFFNLCHSWGWAPLRVFVGGPAFLFRQPTFFPNFFSRHGGIATKKTLRFAERSSIRGFVEKHRHYLHGRVLDFGSGDEPYRDLVDGEYVPFEKGDEFPDGKFDAVLVNQVVQYLDDPRRELERLARVTDLLVMTYPTHWEELESIDYWRFTKAGMEKMLREAGFEVIHHEPRHALQFYDFSLVIGYGVVAKTTQSNKKED